jgi:hypothetical protein
MHTGVGVKGVIKRCVVIVLMISQEYTECLPVLLMKLLLFPAPNDQPLTFCHVNNNSNSTATTAIGHKNLIPLHHGPQRENSLTLTAWLAIFQCPNTISDHGSGPKWYISAIVTQEVRLSI